VVVPRTCRRAFCCLAGLFLLSPQSGAAELGRPPSASPPPHACDLRDIYLTLEARRLLHQDRELARFSLGVSVNQGVAVVWGRLPTETLARRALEYVRQVRGVFEVHQELQILPFEHGTEPPDIKPSDEDKPKRDPISPGALVGRAGPKPTPSAATNIVEPPPVSAAVSLLPPVPVVVPLAGSVPLAVLLPPAAPAAPVSLESAVEQLRRSDRRFQQVRAEVRQRTVYLSGTVARADDLRALAQLVSRLPGVSDVIIENSHVATPR
jgi:hypothetical protein